MLGARRDHQHRLICSHDTHHGAVFGHQDIAATHQGASGQEDAQLAALAVGGVKTAFLAHVPIEFNGGGALEQHGGQALALGEEFVDGEHAGSVRQNRK